MDEDSHKLIDWLTRQPLNTVIEWNSGDITLKEPWRSGYIDICISEAERENITNWSWTIVGPGDEDVREHPESLWQFVAPYDLDIHYVYGSESYIYAISIPTGTLLNPEDETRLTRIMLEGPNRTYGVSGGWSVDAINNALGEWTSKYTGRSDLRFRWNPDLPESKSGVIKEAMAIREKIQKGEESTYDLGDNVNASGRAVDFLLNHPNEASAMMRDLKK